MTRPDPIPQNVISHTCSEEAVLRRNFANLKDLQERLHDGDLYFPEIHAGNWFDGDENQLYSTDEQKLTLKNLHVNEEIVLGDNLVWKRIDGTVILVGFDLCKVKVNEGDDCDYLEDQFFDHNASAEYSSARDLAIDVDTEADGGDDKLRLFADASAISGYTEANQQVLTHSASGGFAWVDVDTSSC